MIAKVHRILKKPCVKNRKQMVNLGSTRNNSQIFPYLTIEFPLFTILFFLKSSTFASKLYRYDKQPTEKYI